MKRRTIAMTLHLVWAMALLGGCSGDDTGSVAPAPAVGKGSVSGMVGSRAGGVLAGVLVTADGTSTTTDQEGYFVLSDLPEGDQVVKLSHSGYAPNVRFIEIVAGANAYFPDLALMPVENVIIDAATGGTATTGDGRGAVVFTPNSFVTAAGAAYDGDVTVSINVAVPGDLNFYGVFPGRYEGIRDDGEVVLIQSFGFLNVDLFATDGAPLELAVGTMAELRLDMGADLAGSAPGSLPLWYLDETDGQWHEEGIATLDGTTYEGSVSHFSAWNCDYVPDGPQLCEIVGYVRRDNGDPVDQAQVTALTPEGGLGAVTFTNEQGFYRIRFVKNEDVSIWAAKGEDLSTPVFTNLGEICPAEIDLPFDVFDPLFVVTLTWVAEQTEPLAHFYLPRTIDDGQDPDYQWTHVSDRLVGLFGVHPHVLLAPHRVFEGEPDRLFGEKFTVGTNEFWVSPAPGSSIDGLAGSDATVTLEMAGTTRTFRVNTMSTNGLQGSDWWHVFNFDVAADSTAVVVPVMQFEIPHDRETVYPDGESD